MAFGLDKIFSSLKGNKISQPQKVVGIDFGSSSVKVAEIELRENVLTLTTYGELQLGPYAQTGLGNVVRLDGGKRIEALVDIFRESGVSTKNAVLALPLTDSFVTVMSLPVKKDEDIGARVPVEARKYIPVPLTDVTLEWVQLPQEKEEDALSTEILIAAIQNTALAEMRVLMNAVQMANQPFEIELFSSLRAAAKENDTSIGVIDLGALTSKLYISENGYLNRIHRVRAGGAQVTELLAKNINLSFEEAENIKRNFSGEGQYSEEIKKNTALVYDRTLQEFKRVITHHQSRKEKPLQRIVLIGGGSLMHNFAQYAGYHLDCEVTLCNPFNKVAYPAFMEDKLREIGPIFTTAIGAALRSFE